MMNAEEVHDPVKQPKHYTQHPSGVECITVTEHMNFCLGNAVKYIWRADLKGGLEDLQKARWYVEREIARRMAATKLSGRLANHPDLVVGHRPDGLDVV